MLKVNGYDELGRIWITLLGFTVLLYVLRYIKNNIFDDEEEKKKRS